MLQFKMETVKFNVQYVANVSFIVLALLTSEVNVAASLVLTPLSFLTFFWHTRQGD